MQSHACTTDFEVVYICASQFDGNDRSCTAFNGKSFKNVTSTKTGHIYGAMAIYEGDPFIAGGQILG